MDWNIDQIWMEMDWSGGGVKLCPVSLDVWGPPFLTNKAWGIAQPKTIQYVCSLRGALSMCCVCVGLFISVLF